MGGLGRVLILGLTVVGLGLGIESWRVEDVLDF